MSAASKATKNKVRGPKAYNFEEDETFHNLADSLLVKSAPKEIESTCTKSDEPQPIVGASEKVKTSEMCTFEGCRRKWKAECVHRYETH